VSALRSVVALTATALVCAPCFAQPHAAADLGKRVLAAGLDPAECYRVRDLDLSEEDIRFYLTDGYLMFGKPVEGAPLTAVFSADTDGGDAEVLLLPPDRSERKTMAAYAGSPNLDEHFQQAAFIFTEQTARALLERVRANGARNAPDVGALMNERWGRVIANLMSGFESRIVLDLLTPGAKGGFFEAVVDGRKLGNFDLIYDARGYEQVIVGQITNRKNVSFWDTWSSFQTRERRGAPQEPLEEQILSYKIDASLDPALTMHCVTRMRVRVTEQSRNILAFDLSGQMRAISAKVDGKPAEVYERDSVRSGLVRNTGNELLMVLPGQPLAPGSEHEVEIEHEGKVVVEAGHGVYFVSARGTWYPGRGLQFANYDVTYRYPAGLDLVAAGRVMEDRIEGDAHITRRAPESKLRLLGFNLGKFERMKQERNGITVEVLANKDVEDALRPRQPEPDISTLDTHPRRRAPPNVEPLAPQAPPPPHPASRMGGIADEVLDSMSFYEAKFGDPLLRHIEVSPLPGRFGQGFGGIIYLPTVNYVMSDSSAANKDQGFFRDLLLAHEVAHQWWGNIVSSNSYHHEWLMEALANYSALMYMESKVGAKADETALEVYRRNLFLKGPDGETTESEGPVVQGRRLEGSNNPAAYTAVIYGKGTWILHMLRRRMGDERFLKMLAELRRRYQFQALDTDGFRKVCAEFLPPGSIDPKLEGFFDQWVYGTGVPALKLTYSVKGKPGAYKLTGTLTQSDVDEDFSIAIPVEIQTGRGKPIVQQVRTSSDPVSFTVNVGVANARAVLDPGMSVLRQ